MKLVHTLCQIQGGFNFQEDVYAPTAKFVEENKQALAITGCVLAATGAVFAGYKYGAFSMFQSRFTEKTENNIIDSQSLNNVDSNMNNNNG